MFAIIHRSMAWIYNCKCVHLDERRSRWNSLKRAMKIIIIPFSTRSRWRSNQTTRCISSRKFMYEPENQNGFTLEPIIEHLLLQLHVCFAGSGNSHDFFSRWTSCHEQNTWYIHTMRKEKKRHSRNIWEMNPSTHFITITILLTCSKKIYFENKIKHISFNYYHDVICEMILEAHVTPDIQNTPPPSVEYVYAWICQAIIVRSMLFKLTLLSPESEDHVKCCLKIIWSDLAFRTWTCS